MYFHSSSHRPFINKGASYKLKSPRTFWLGLIIGWLTELRKTVHLLDYQFIIKGYNLGTARWKRCIKQGMEKRTQNFHVLWTYYSPGTSMCSTSNPFLLPRDLGEMESSNPLITRMVPLPTRPHPEGIQEPHAPVISLAYRKTPTTLEISEVFRSCVAGNKERGHVPRKL